ncbi:MAG: hypothetical protein HY717_01660 [Planctomycetes bacterium]|nr:hypothetical protein [Planctomycetota bacterium]
MNRNGTTLTTKRLSRTEIIRMIERGAKARRRMTAKQLITNYRKGKLEDPGEVADLLGLAGLLSKSDSLFVAP